MLKQAHEGAINTPREIILKASQKQSNPRYDYCTRASTIYFPIIVIALYNFIFFFIFFLPIYM
jgi:hypothetical protein